MSDSLSDRVKALGDIQTRARAKKRKQNRQAMPLTASFVDQLTEVFGSVRALSATENGKMMGKPLSDAGYTDVDKILRLDDMSKARRAKNRG